MEIGQKFAKKIKFISEHALYTIVHFLWTTPERDFKGGLYPLKPVLGEHLTPKGNFYPKLYPVTLVSFSDLLLSE